MTDSDRYMLIFSLILFFGFMALGLVIINSTSKTEAAMQQLNNRLETVAKAAQKKKTGDLYCYKDDELKKFLNAKATNENFMPFLTAKTSNDNGISVYLDATPEGIGSYFILKTNNGEKDQQTGCILAEGDGMKVALPTPEPDEVSEAITEAVEETSEAPIEETIEAVKDVIEESTEAITEAVEEVTEKEVKQGAEVAPQ